MKAPLCFLTDVLGNRYLGFRFDERLIDDYLVEWITSFPETENDLVEELMFNRQKRDGEHYHCTFVNVMDYKKLTDTSEEFNCEELLGTEFHFEAHGIGKAEDKGNQAHFIVLECDKLQALRAHLGLRDHDFHITIGFDKKDVFGQPKNHSSIYIPFN